MHVCNTWFCMVALQITQNWQKYKNMFFIPYIELFNMLIQKFESSKTHSFRIFECTKTIQTQQFTFMKKSTSVSTILLVSNMIIMLSRCNLLLMSQQTTFLVLCTGNYFNNFSKTGFDLLPSFISIMISK